MGIWFLELCLNFLSYHCFLIHRYFLVGFESTARGRKSKARQAQLPHCDEQINSSISRPISKHPPSISLTSSPPPLSSLSKMAIPRSFEAQQQLPLMTNMNPATTSVVVVGGGGGNMSMAKPPRPRLNPADFPEQPRVEKVSRHIRIFYNGMEIAETRDAYWMLEMHRPPSMCSLSLFCPCPFCLFLII